MRDILLNILEFLYYRLPSQFHNKIERYIQRLDGGQMYSHRIRKIYSKKYKINIGYGSYGGCFAPLNIPPNVTFGNYCSIAKNVIIFRANHPKDLFTLHPLLYNPIAGYVKTDMLNRPPLTIGHDVWIGEGSTILPSVYNIGNGSIIGAGSVVTKNVEAYSIVAGNPAKVIGCRFSDKDMISKLEATKWWELSKENLIGCVHKLNQIVEKVD